MSFEVDQFTTEQSWQEFMTHHHALGQTIGALGLRGLQDEAPGLIFGGSAPTAYLIDSRFPGKEPSDLDVIVPNAMFERLTKTGFLTHTRPIQKRSLQGYIKPSEAVPLKVDVITTFDHTELAMYIGDEPYLGKPNSTVKELDGIHVLWPGVAAMQKVQYANRTRIKDLAGIVKAQVVASHRDHPILGDEAWQDAVARAVDRLANNRVAYPLWRKIMRKGPNYPSWIRELIEADFDHPAFADIQRI